MAALSIAVLCVRIALTNTPYADGDKSRWMTVYSLYYDRTFALNELKARYEGDREGNRFSDIAGVDLMADPATGKLYSSKPPVLATLVYLETVVLAKTLGWDPLEDHSKVLRAVLVTFNAAPFALALLALALALRRLDADPRASAVIVLSVGLGSFAQSFGVVLNNHTIGASAALIAVCAYIGIRTGGSRLVLSLAAGLGVGVALSQELPALTLLCALGMLLLLEDPARTLLFGAPAALGAVLVRLASNTAAFGKPLFFMRVPHEWYRFDGSYWQSPLGIDSAHPGVVEYAFHFLVGHHGWLVLTPVLVLALGGLFAPWFPARPSLKAAALVSVVLLACLLVPGLLRKTYRWPHYIALLPAVGLGGLAMFFPWRWWRDAATLERLQRLAFACVLPTLVFYLEKTDNYGGKTVGPRWLMWLTPVLAPLLIGPVTRLLSSARGRIVLAVLMLLSIFSSLWPGLAPYEHPWTYPG